MQMEIHAKLTGAGGGGCVICFPKDPDFETNGKHELFELFQSKGYTVYDNIAESKQGLVYEIV